MKITFMGAGSTVFARNVIGDCMCTEALRDSEFALYDIDGVRLEESRTILEAIQKAKSENYDVILIDTAGRLQNKFNLMEELSKIKNVIDMEKLGM